VAARTLLLKLEQRNWIQLPARRCRPCSRMRHKQVLCLDHDTQPIVGVLADLAPLRVEELTDQPEGRPLWPVLGKQETCHRAIRKAKPRVRMTRSSAG